MHSLHPSNIPRSLATEKNGLICRCGLILVECLGPVQNNSPRAGAQQESDRPFFTPHIRGATPAALLLQGGASKLICRLKSSRKGAFPVVRTYPASASVCSKPASARICMGTGSVDLACIPGMCTCPSFSGNSQASCPWKLLKEKQPEEVKSFSFYAKLPSRNSRRFP